MTFTGASDTQDPITATTSTDEAVRPFTIAVDQADLDDLADRLARTRLPRQAPGDDWTYGTPNRYLAVMVEECRRLDKDASQIYLNVVVQRPALGELADIVRLAARHQLTRVALNPVTLPAGHPFGLDGEAERLRDALAEVQRTADELGVEVRIGAALHEEFALPEVAGKRCTHPWMYAYINYRGQVGFCDHLIGSDKTEYLLGDLTRSSFEEIWNGRAYQDLRRQHVAWRSGLSAAFEECNWCYRNRYVDIDDLTYPPYAGCVVSTTASPGLFVPPRRATRVELTSGPRGTGPA